MLISPLTPHAAKLNLQQTPPLLPPSFCLFPVTEKSYPFCSPSPGRGVGLILCIVLEIGIVLPLPRSVMGSCEPTAPQTGQVCGLAPRFGKWHFHRFTDLTRECTNTAIWTELLQNRLFTAPAGKGIILPHYTDSTLLTAISHG